MNDMHKSAQCTGDTYLSNYNYGRHIFLRLQCLGPAISICLVTDKQTTNNNDFLERDQYDKLTGPFRSNS